MCHHKRFSAVVHKKIMCYYCFFLSNVASAMHLMTCKGMQNNRPKSQTIFKFCALLALRLIYAYEIHNARLPAHNNCISCGNMSCLIWLICHLLLYSRADWAWLFRLRGYHFFKGHQLTGMPKENHLISNIVSGKWNLVDTGRYMLVCFRFFWEFCKNSLPEILSAVL